MEQTIDEYQGPLAGLNVIDFGHYYAGPMAGMLLADQGANVIRIVRPGDPELPSPQYRLLNRNKKLLTLDLKTEEGKNQALSLIERADVLIENFRPGVMKRLGLDYASVKASKPGLVYLSLPGFASTDKERAHIQAWEGVMSAATGVFDPRWPLQQLGFPPVYDDVPICSAAGSMQGAIAVMSALVACEEHGQGSLIETPLIEAGLSAYCNYFTMRSASGSMTRIKPTEELEPFTFSANDNNEERLTKLNAIQDREDKLMQTKCYYYKSYPTSDGRTLLFWLWQRPAQVENFFKALGLDKRLKREGFVNLGPCETGLDNNLSGNFHIPEGAMSPEKNQYIVDLVTEVLLTKTAAEWETIMTDAGVPFSVVYTQEEWLSLEPMLKSGVNVNMPKKDDSTLTVPGRIVDVSGPNGRQLKGFFEAQEISAADASAMLINKAPQQPTNSTKDLKKGDLLKGLKVLDLCNIVAGPTSTYTLAQFGAEVIRADAPHETPAIMDFMLDQNQGKRSIITDVKTAQGREIFERLISWADIVVHNILDDTAKRLGISQRQLEKIKPDIISCQVSTFSGIYRGGWENRAGYDQIAKVATGMKTRFGTIEKPKGPPSEWIIADVMGGLCLSYAALLALYQKRTKGIGAEARASLVRGNNYIYLPYMIAENGVSAWGKNNSFLDKGPTWWQHLYECKDGWIYVGAGEDRADSLAKTVLGQAQATVSALEAAFSRQDCAYWINELRNADIGCHSVLTLEQILDQAPVCLTDNAASEEIASGGMTLMRQDRHPCGRPITTIAPTWVRIGEQQTYKKITPAPRYGEHTREILSELGYSEAEINELIRLRISHDYLPGIGDRENYFFEPEKTA